MSKPPATTHLRLHRRLWRYDRFVPPELRPFMPEGYRGTRFRVYLKTPDLAAALRVRPKLDAQFADMVEQARRRMEGTEGDAVQQGVDAAMYIRREEGHGAPLPDEVYEAAYQALPKVARPVFSEVLGTGLAPVTILRHVPEWLERTSYLHPKTLLERRITLNHLNEWCTVRGIADVRKFSRDIAKLFIKEHCEGKAPSTTSKVLQSVRGYWAFLKDEGVTVDPDIWNNLAPKKSRRDELRDRERPFSDDELRALFRGDKAAGVYPSPRLLDTMTIAYLTGMRLGEIGDLKIDHVDLTKKVIHVPGTKTAASVRTIPIAPALTKVLVARVKGRGKGEYIIHEVEDRERKYGRKRSAQLSVEFMRYREKVGVDERREGKRRALTNFHSFRRTAAKHMIEAGVAANVVDGFFGWAEQGVMRVRYTAGADLMKQMREAVEKLKLPG